MGEDGSIADVADEAWERVIRVNLTSVFLCSKYAISPGYVDTPMNSMILSADELRAGFAAGHMTGLQTSEEIADLVVFLASDLSRSMTGATVNCDRGWTAFKMPEVLARTMGGG